MSTFSNLFFNLSGPQDQFASLKAAKDAGAATINYGLFINLVINFVIVAFVMFLLIKGMNKMKKEAPAAAPCRHPRVRGPAGGDPRPAEEVGEADRR